MINFKYIVVMRKGRFRRFDTCSMFSMSRYLSQARIEEPIWLEPMDISILQNRVIEMEMQVGSFESQMRELESAYKAQISDAESIYKARIDECIRKKDVALMEISSLRNVLSPVRRVPLEILSENYQLAYDPFDAARYIFTICTVCVAWRKAA